MYVLFDLKHKVYADIEIKCVIKFFTTRKDQI